MSRRRRIQSFALVLSVAVTALSLHIAAETLRLVDMIGIFGGGFAMGATVVSMLKDRRSGA